MGGTRGVRVPQQGLRPQHRRRRHAVHDIHAVEELRGDSTAQLGGVPRGTQRLRQPAPESIWKPAQFTQLLGPNPPNCTTHLQLPLMQQKQAVGNVALHTQVLPRRHLHRQQHAAQRAALGVAQVPAGRQGG